MKIALAKIVITPVRIRREPGDLERLQNSISQVGLLHPLLVDEQYQLISGYRRYLACKGLGLHEVEVKMISCEGDQHKLLDLELAENIGRRDFTEPEICRIAKRRKAIDQQLRGNWWQRLCRRWRKFWQKS